MNEKKKYYLEKESKYSRVKEWIKDRIIPVRIGIAAIGTILAFSLIVPKVKENITKKNLTSTSMEKLLKEYNNDTLIDELADEQEKDTAIQLERLLESSEKIELLRKKSKKYNLNVKEMTISEFDKLDKKEYSIDNIEKDLEIIEEYIKKIKSGDININIPSKETTDFFQLYTKILKEDSAVCNNEIAHSYEPLKEIYYNVVSSAYLKECGLTYEENKNISYSSNEDDENPYYILNYTDPSLKEISKDNFSCKILVDNFEYNVSILTDNANRISRFVVDYHPKYNKDRNEILRDALNDLKLMFGYEFKIVKNPITGTTRIKGYFNSEKIVNPKTKIKSH